MERLISTNALMKRINCYPNIREIVKKELRYVPTVDPVKHGHWKEDATRIRDQCSVCGLSVNWSQYKTPYCPLCGAKMDEVKDGKDD